MVQNKAYEYKFLRKSNQYDKDSFNSNKKYKR